MDTLKEVAQRARTARGQMEFTFWPRHNRAILERLESKHAYLEHEHDALDAEMVLNLGPQHPATHGVLRCLLRLDGEIIDTCVVDLGYLHRGLEKFAEYKTFYEFMPYTDRMDYLAPYSNNVAFCLAVEKLCGIEVPERAQYIRTMLAELARISAHLLWLGTMVMDAGAVSVFLWAFRFREDIYSIFDEITGVRFNSMEGMIHDFLLTDVGPAAPKGAESYHAIEAPKGELGFYFISNGTGRPWRMRIKSPSFCNLQGLEYMLEGAMVADTVVLIGSVDPVMGEADK